MDISIVYLGNKLPRYLLKNLIYLKLTFPNEKFVFISDNEVSLAKVKKIGFEIWKFNSLANYQEKYKGLLEHDYEFRSNFWFNTLARFFAINEYMYEHSTNSHLHIEADNFLFPNFPFDYFRNCANTLSFPLESKDMGVASILFIPDLNSAKILVEFSINEMLINSKATDMTILGAISNSTEYKVNRLGVIPKELMHSLRFTENAEYFTSNLDLIGLFDAITHGQYLLGIDPRNFRGIRKVYLSVPSHELQANKLHYKYSIEDESIILTNGIHHWPIYNLHNHSKDLRMYSKEKRAKILQRRIQQNRGVVKNEYLPSVFAQSLLKSIFRRMKKLLQIQQLFERDANANPFSKF